MQEKTEKQMINLEKLEHNFLDTLPLSKFIFNQDNPYMSDSSSDSNIIIKQETQLIKPGRKRKCPLKNGEKPHDKDARDNILRKIQVHYLTFIVDFMNDLLNHLGYNYEFIDIDYNIKKDIRKKSFSLLKKKNIGEILCQEISPKFRTQKKENNYIIYDKVKSDEVVNYFFSQNFMKLFKEVYLKNKRNINEKGFHFQLSEKVQTFDDLLNKTKAYDDKNEYKKKVDEVIKNNYLNHFVIKKN